MDSIRRLQNRLFQATSPLFGESVTNPPTPSRDKTPTNSDENLVVTIGNDSIEHDAVPTKESLRPRRLLRSQVTELVDNRSVAAMASAPRGKSSSQRSRPVTRGSQILSHEGPAPNAKSLSQSIHYASAADAAPGSRKKCDDKLSRPVVREGQVPSDAAPASELRSSTQSADGAVPSTAAPGPSKKTLDQPSQPVARAGEVSGDVAPAFKPESMSHSAEGASPDTAAEGPTKKSSDQSSRLVTHGSPQLSASASPASKAKRSPQLAEYDYAAAAVPTPPLKSSDQPLRPVTRGTHLLPRTSPASKAKSSPQAADNDSAATAAPALPLKCPDKPSRPVTRATQVSVHAAPVSKAMSSNQLAMPYVTRHITTRAAKTRNLPANKHDAGANAPVAEQQFRPRRKVRARAEPLSTSDGKKMSAGSLMQGTPTSPKRSLLTPRQQVPPVESNPAAPPVMYSQKALSKNVTDAQRTIPSTLIDAAGKSTGVVTRCKHKEGEKATERDSIAESDDMMSPEEKTIIGRKERSNARTIARSNTGSKNNAQACVQAWSSVGDAIHKNGSDMGSSGVQKEPLSQQKNPSGVLEAKSGDGKGQECGNDGKNVLLNDSISPLLVSPDVENILVVDVGASRRGSEGTPREKYGKSAELGTKKSQPTVTQKLPSQSAWSIREKCLKSLRRRSAGVAEALEEEGRKQNVNGYMKSDCSPGDLRPNSAKTQGKDSNDVGDLAPEEQVSTIFTEPDDDGLERPMLFYIGVCASDRLAIARSIVVNGGRLVLKSGTNTDVPPVYPLIDSKSCPDPRGRFTYSDTYILNCIEAGEKLDIEEYRLGRRRLSLSRRDLVDMHIIAAGVDIADVSPHRGQNQAPGDGRSHGPVGTMNPDSPNIRKRSAFSAEEDVMIMAFGTQKVQNEGFTQGCRSMWAKFIESNALGRTVTVESLRGRFRLLSKRSNAFNSGASRKRLLASSPERAVKRVRASHTTRLPVESKSISGSNSNPQPVSPDHDNVNNSNVSDSNVVDSSDDNGPDFENEEVTHARRAISSRMQDGSSTQSDSDDCEEDAHARRVFSSRAQDGPISQSDSDYCEEDAHACRVFASRAQDRTESDSESNDSMDEESEAPSDAEPTEHLLKVVKEMSETYGVSQRKAFIFLKASNGNMDDACIQLSRTVERSRIKPCRRLREVVAEMAETCGMSQRDVFKVLRGCKGDVLAAWEELGRQSR